MATKKRKAKQKSGNAPRMNEFAMRNGEDVVLTHDLVEGVFSAGDTVTVKYCTSRDERRITSKDGERTAMVGKQTLGFRCRQA